MVYAVIRAPGDTKNEDHKRLDLVSYGVHIRLVVMAEKLEGYEKQRKLAETFYREGPYAPDWWNF